MHNRTSTVYEDLAHANKITLRDRPWMLSWTRKQHRLPDFYVREMATRPLPFFYLYQVNTCGGPHCSCHRTCSPQVSTIENNLAIRHCADLFTFLSQQSLMSLSLHLSRWSCFEDYVHMLFARKSCLRIACSRRITLLREVELITDYSLPIFTL